MMTDPDPGVSPGNGDLTRRGELQHLCCHCQLRAAPRHTLCGLDAGGLAHTPLLDDGDACVVCYDLAKLVLIVRRCERCPR